MSQLPDAEFILGSLLRADPLISTYDARVSGKLPTTFSRPWIRVTQLDCRDVTGNGLSEYVAEYMMQFDCYASEEEFDAQAEASGLAFTARAVLMEAVKSTVLGTVISAVTFVSHAHLPDEDLDPPRERYSLTANVILHAG